MITIEQAKHAWAHEPKGKYNAKQRADFATAEWSMVQRPKKRGEEVTVSDPVLTGTKWKVTAKTNEKQNITFTLEKV